MSEASLVTKIKRALRKERGGRWIKVHGGPFQEAGISDIVGCWHGVFYALEVKLPGKENTLTPLQQAFIDDINLSGGKAAMVISVDQALELVK